MCPQVAAPLGRCLAKAAVGAVPAGCAVLHVPDPAYEGVRPIPASVLALSSMS